MKCFCRILVWLIPLLSFCNPLAIIHLRVNKLWVIITWLMTDWWVEPIHDVAALNGSFVNRVYLLLKKNSWLCNHHSPPPPLDSSPEMNQDVYTRVFRQTSLRFPVASKSRYQLLPLRLSVCLSTDDCIYSLKWGFMMIWMDVLCRLAREEERDLNGVFA